MWPLLIVLAEPQIEIGLQLVDRTIHLFAERDTVELVENRFVEALADSVGLRALGLGSQVIDVLDRKVKLVFVSLRVATILTAAVGQYAQKLDIVLLELRHHPIIESRSAALIGAWRASRTSHRHSPEQPAIVHPQCVTALGWLGWLPRHRTSWKQTPPL